ncbi:MAG: bacillithiol biosynthesis deacetylase BshB1 [Acidobacteria bacterium]|jgi:bacillithiol biosynthesis deacetylase BshB1|nr:bacillithiol biosynthesis deacetylase BshB1 [Acidobacteriota bacterium]MEE2965576.1 bacillithiol biosynthesis deacetylase BshB1 [Acidobacteriota bacterium]HCD02328.1 bacillithiol biosynthesis deacetylase BshB1 [Planctomycetaceae bacterium]
MDMSVDLLAFGPHPDDIEIGIGGTVSKQARCGHRVGLCDLTRGELGSNGTVDERRSEAEAGAEVLGAAWRENLEWPDGEIGGPDQLRSAVECLRRNRPATVLIPHWADRHPDHVAASQLLTRAVFTGGLRKYIAEGDPWRPDWVCYYFINGTATPSFVVDVSDDYETKRRALDCHRSQFTPEGAGAVSTRLTTSRFRQLIETRDAGFGVSVGVAFAEGFIVKEPILRSDVMK